MNELSVQQILKDILADNINLLNSRDELSTLLNQKTPGYLVRELAVVQKALQYNVGEYFLQAHLANTQTSRFIALGKVTEILQQANLQEQSIQKVIHTFLYALSWINEQKIQTSQLNNIEKENIPSQSLNIDELAQTIKFLDERINTIEDNISNTNLQTITKHLDSEITKLKKELFFYIKANTSDINKINLYLQKQTPKGLSLNVPKLKIPQNFTLAQYKRLESLWWKFIKEYNVLSNSTTYAPQDKTNIINLILNNDMKFFDCKNAEARLANPSLAMDFKSVDTAKGMYWALSLKNSLYAVVPKLKTTYEFQLHETAGMKETFESNYNRGLYNKIIVKRPAIFDYTNGTWTLKERGEIELSN